MDRSRSLSRSRAPRSVYTSFVPFSPVPPSQSLPSPHAVHTANLSRIHLALTMLPFFDSEDDPYNAKWQKDYTRGCPRAIQWGA
jgi:hypothetical protein